VSDEYYTEDGKYTLLGLAVKIDWEGGLDSALHYGIRHDQIDPFEEEVVRLWKNLEIAWKVFSEAEDQVMELLPEPE
jgi:hypothetical protein